MMDIWAKREEMNLTQKQLVDKNGLSTRTKQCIETGTEPQGHAFKVQAKAFGVEVAALRENSLPLTVLPPFNIFALWSLYKPK